MGSLGSEEMQTCFLLWSWIIIKSHMQCMYIRKFFSVSVVSSISVFTSLLLELFNIRPFLFTLYWVYLLCDNPEEFGATIFTTVTPFLALSTVALFLAAAFCTAEIF